MKKRGIIISFSAVLFLVIILTSVIIFKNNQINDYKNQIENEYARSLNELNSGINNISLLLEKVRYATTPTQISALAASLYSEAEISKSALSQLPLNEGPDTVNRFLSQVGNYALSISKSLISGEKLNDKVESNLKILSETAKKIAQVVSDSNITYNSSDYWVEELEEKLNSSEDKVSLADSLTELEENLTDYPTLIYDGPYSDHILNKEPIFLENKPQVTEEEGLTIAADILDLPIDSVNFLGSAEGKIPSYRYGIDNTEIALSKNGGYVVYFRKTRDIGESEFDYNKCLSAAKNYLTNLGFKNMKETYYFTDSGICVINFSYLDGQTICYTDLIKIGVAVDNTEIMFIETTGYLYNHTERAFEVAKYSKEEAEKRISKLLKINNVNVALIPSSGGGEKRCYEFMCTGEDDREIIVYINVQTLEEEQIFILLKTDGGVLVK